MLSLKRKLLRQNTDLTNKVTISRWKSINIGRDYEESKGKFCNFEKTIRKKFIAIFTDSAGPHLIWDYKGTNPKTTMKLKKKKNLPMWIDYGITKRRRASENSTEHKLKITRKRGWEKNNFNLNWGKTRTLNDRYLLVLSGTKELWFYTRTMKNSASVRAIL